MATLSPVLHTLCGISIQCIYEIANDKHIHYVLWVTAFFVLHVPIGSRTLHDSKKLRIAY